MTNISIIIPTYNCAKYLSQAVASVLNQSYSNFEIIVVDDGSTDETKKVMRDYRGNEKIKYIRQDNGGPSSARNRGIISSAGKYICFLDADDFYNAESLRLRMEALQRYDVDFVIGKTRVLRASDKAEVSGENFLSEYADCVENNGENIYLCDSLKFFKVAIKKGIFFQTNSITFKKDSLLKLGMFDETLRVSEDLDLWFRAFLHTKQFIFINDVLSTYNYYRNSFAKDLNRLFLYERKRYIKNIKLLNESNFDKELIAIVKRRICKRKYITKGIMEYRHGSNFKALKFFIKAWWIHKEDKGIPKLIFKAVFPKIIREFLKNFMIKLKALAWTK